MAARLGHTPTCTDTCHYTKLDSVTTTFLLLFFAYLTRTDPLDNIPNVEELIVQFTFHSVKLNLLRSTIQK